jgi:hypothetical protein
MLACSFHRQDKSFYVRAVWITWEYDPGDDFVPLNPVDDPSAVVHCKEVAVEDHLASMT